MKRSGTEWVVAELGADVFKYLLVALVVAVFLMTTGVRTFKMWYFLGAVAIVWLFWMISEE